ncbi:hypothetical protein ACWJU0_11075 [Clostridioides difficile]|uniref:hypothetical protein n=1 Tax=Clostridioides difficile TaxID=1496 RepID=UPI000A96964F|nr:hypothetical protein [Clostridioides difficile]HBG7257224.1 hypothetical protein [Clostridioides difficile]
MQINYQYYPKHIRMPNHLNDVVSIFNNVYNKIDSFNHNLKSNEVLAVIEPQLLTYGYDVERKVNGTTRYIEVPVLFGRNNKMEKSFRADAYYENQKTVIEVEAGRGVLNNQFLKDLFQACMMQDVEYLCIAVRNVYKTKQDFEEVCRFFDALYSSDRFNLPLNGILVIGY